MESPEIGLALQRVETLLRRRPAAGRGEDTPASARREEGLRVVTTHPSGAQVVTDMPVSFGGIEVSED